MRVACLKGGVHEVPRPAVSGWVRWSDPATWAPGDIPVNGDNVLIPSGMQMLWDCETANLGTVTIAGTLKADTSRSVKLTATGIELTGSWEIGSSTAAFPRQFTADVVLIGAKPANPGVDDPDGLMRGLLITGQLHWYGYVPAVTKTKLNATANAGATSLTLEDAVDWPAGSEIAIAPTTWYGVSETDRRTLTATASGTSVALHSGLSYRRYGKMQYVVDAAVSASGLSETPGTLTRPSNPALADYIDSATWDLIPKTIDERAEVVLLSRNIRLMGPDDVDWKTKQYGAHTMCMQGGEYLLQGVEFVRCGQQGIVGRYPIHWHMMSYEMLSGMGSPSTGVFIGDLSGQFVKHCSVHDSAQRFVTIHGTCGAVVEDNVAYDIAGAALFLEDGSERRNIMRRNWIGNVREPLLANKIREFDFVSGDTGPPGIWFTNADNVLEDNVVFDAPLGIWNSFAQARVGYPGGCMGLSGQVAVTPINVPALSYSGNTAHTCQLSCALTNMGMTDTAGHTTVVTYAPQIDGIPPVGPDSNTYAARSTFRGSKFWAGNNNGYSNRVGQMLEYVGWTVSNNYSQHLIGQASYRTLVHQTLFVGKTLNPDLQGLPPSKTVDLRQAIASYHHGPRMYDSLVVNLPFSGPFTAYPNDAQGGAQLVAGGWLKTSDLYLNFLEDEARYDTGVHAINSCRSFLAPSRSMEAEMQTVYPTGRTSILAANASYTSDNMGVAPVTHASFSISGGVYPDIYSTTAGSWIVQDRPLFTYGKTVSRDSARLGPNVSVVGPFYGVRPVALDGHPTGNTMSRQVQMTRLDAAGADVDTTNLPDHAWFVTGKVTPGGGKGDFTAPPVFTTKPNTPNEVVTFTALTATTFAVSGTVMGAQPTLTVGTPYSCPYFSVQINAGGTAFVAGDVLRFTIYTRADFLGLNRHIGFAGDSRWRIEFPDDTAPTSRVAFQIGYLKQITDKFVMCVPWDGAVPVEVGCGVQGADYTTGQSSVDIAAGRARNYTSAASLAALDASAGDTYWQDVANDVVWVKPRGGFNPATNWPVSPTELQDIKTVDQAMATLTLVPA